MSYPLELLEDECKKVLNQLIKIEQLEAENKKLKKHKEILLNELKGFIKEGPINVDEYIWGDSWRDKFAKVDCHWKGFNDKEYKALKDTTP